MRFPPLEDIKTVKIIPDHEDFPLMGFGGIPFNVDHVLGNNYDLEYMRNTEYKIAKWCYEYSTDLTLTFELKDR